MTDSTLFKEMAVKEFPERIYQELEPQMDLMLACLRKHGMTAHHLAESYEAYTRNLFSRYFEVRREFDKEKELMWPKFAKERWPEIEEHFDIDPHGKQIECCHRPVSLFQQVPDQLPF